MIARRLLLSKLKVVAPAVATNEMIPYLTHVCLTGTHLIACNHNSTLAISTPRTTEFQGCIPAAIFTDLLAKSRAAVVELKADGDKVAMKLGTTTIKLPMRSVEEFANFFTMPRMPQQNLLAGIAGRFFAGIAHCLQSIEENSVCPDKLGITLIPDHGELQLYSTNSITMSRATVALPNGNKFKRVILNTAFCQQMLHLARRAQTIRLAIMSDHALFLADDTLLFGRLIETDRPVDYVGVFTSHVSVEHPVPIPHRTFGPMLKRVNGIVGVVGSEPYTEVTIKDGVATFHGKSQRGEVIETLRLDRHPDIEVKVHISSVCKAYSAFSHILFGERAVVLARDEHLYMVATGIG